MKRKNLLITLSVVFIATVLVSVLSSVMAKTPNKTEASFLSATCDVAFLTCCDSHNNDEITQEVEVVNIENEFALDWQTASEKIEAMLNINYCYNSSFESVEDMLNATAVTLNEFLLDMDGYGLCLNAELAKGFIKEFYGNDVDLSGFEGIDAPQGYIAINVTEGAAINHRIVSVQFENGEYTVVSCMKMYFGGDDMEIVLAKTKLVKNEHSQYGFNLIYSEIL